MRLFFFEGQCSKCSLPNSLQQRTPPDPLISESVLFPKISTSPCLVKYGCLTHIVEASQGLDDGSLQIALFEINTHYTKKNEK